MASRQQKKDRHQRDEERRFTVRGIRRNPLDIRKLSKAFIGLAMAEAERQAQADHAKQDTESELTAADEVEPRGEAHG
ncbi:MAG: hypothetical protein LC808_26295 [Actinobacteria bacterium]|nr:hypothetical protein [Actinomycetota bacterium]